MSLFKCQLCKLLRRVEFAGFVSNKSHLTKEKSVKFRIANPRMSKEFYGANFALVNGKSLHLPRAIFLLFS